MPDLHAAGGDGRPSEPRGDARGFGESELFRRRVVRLRIVGVAEPKGSTRAFIPKGWQRPIITSANPRLKDWQHQVATAASVHTGPLLEGAVRLKAAFFLPRPKSLARKVIAHTKKPDLDKLLRAVKDALTGVLYRDDSQVVMLEGSKAYADDVPFVEIEVEGR